MLRPPLLLKNSKRSQGYLSYSIIGFAPSSSAAKVLSELKIQSETVARLLVFGTTTTD
ncbi:hypothetical protein [Nostoc sp. C057]|uniref:hypothetical protein n=1 Tax=Nostoc sp. C057 TaxID=2576903 RepID=UPI0015C40339|nr:hypothetical protein [Nostoc sp. C057]